jgi:hypothetical protein
MNIPSATPKPRLFRCACGLVGKVKHGAYNVHCKGCGRIFGPPGPAHNQGQEAERRPAADG